MGRTLADETLILAKPGVEVFFVFGGGAGVVNLDATVLHRALHHLLRNAAEATRGGENITLRINHEKDDTGDRILFEARIAPLFSLTLPFSASPLSLFPFPPIPYAPF